MSQLTESAEKAESFYLIVTEYPINGEPPSSGATQLITTSSGTQVVIGASGCAGTYAVRIETVFENKSLKPYEFFDLTLN